MENKLIKVILHPEKIIGVLLRSCLGRLLSNETFVKWDYFSGMCKFPDLERPQTYNEKLQWLKINHYSEAYSALVDKYEVKKIVENIIGKQYVIPTLGVWERFDDIDFDELPSQFVLKCTHDSGGLVICHDKATFNIAVAKEKIEKSLNRNYYDIHREYPYKDVKPRIIAEKFMIDSECDELRDYKFFCFNGSVEFLFIASDRPHDTRFDFYDIEFNHMPFTQGHPMSNKKILRPKRFDEMIRLAKVLSKGIPHVRIDFYEVDGDVYFGEMTFFHYSGNVPFEPEEWDLKLGKLLQLPVC